MDMFCETIKKYKSCKDVYSIFEIGARDGVDARKMLSYFPKSDVYAFEAGSDEHRAHIDANEPIKWINVAIYDYDGEVDFHKKGFMSGVNSIRNKKNMSGTVEKIKCMRVDTFCKESGIVDVDFVKVDVEGCTYEVLKSFGLFFKRVSFFHVETESLAYFDGQILEEEVFELLEKDFVMLEKTNRSDGVLQNDSIWINKKLY